MLRVTVEVRAGQTGGPVDLEVPAELPVVELSRLIAAALKLDSDPFGRALRHEVFAVPPGRLLAGGETLASAAVWDGVTLTLTPLLAAYFESAQAAYPLYLSTVTLGRAESAVAGQPNDALLALNGEPQGQHVSRRHAQMIFGQNQWQLLHLSQTNHTAVNGQALAHDLRMALREGDQVELGSVALVFHFGFGPPQPPAAPPVAPPAVPPAVPLPSAPSPYGTRTI